MLRRDHTVLSATNTSHKWTKAIVEYTSPALCTPVTPFPRIGDAAYRQHASRGPSHGHRQHAYKLVEIARVVTEISSRTDRQIDRQTYTSQPLRRQSNEPYMPLLPSHRASPHSGRYSFFRLVEGRRLSWSDRLVTNQGGLPARRRSPIPVLTGPGVE